MTGEDASDVAAYVGYAAARPGEDEGALAQAGLAGATTGEQIFTAAGCGGCHTFSKAGANGNIGPSLDELAAAAATAPRAARGVRERVDPGSRRVHRRRLPVRRDARLRGPADDEQVQALVEYLLEAARALAVRGRRSARLRAGAAAGAPTRGRIARRLLRQTAVPAMHGSWVSPAGRLIGVPSLAGPRCRTAIDRSPASRGAAIPRLPNTPCVHVLSRPTVAMPATRAEVRPT